MSLGYKPCKVGKFFLRQWDTKLLRETKGRAYGNASFNCTLESNEILKCSSYWPTFNFFEFRILIIIFYMIHMCFYIMFHFQRGCSCVRKVLFYTLRAQRCCCVQWSWWRLYILWAWGWWCMQQFMGKIDGELSCPTQICTPFADTWYFTRALVGSSMPEVVHLKALDFCLKFVRETFVGVLRLWIASIGDS
jgi:hypothetical protein